MREIYTILSKGSLRQSARLFASYPCPSLQMPKPVIDTDFYTNPGNRDYIHQNIVSRKAHGDIDRVLQLSHRLNVEQNSDHLRQLKTELESELCRLPNMSHPAVRGLSEPRVVCTRPFTHPGGDTYPLRTFEEIARILGGARLHNLGLMSSERSYYLTGPLAELELGLVNWAVDKLLQEGFQLISVPDILHPDIIARCGMTVDGERTQVYKLDKFYGQAALSGTAEMALGGFLMGKRLHNLPLKLCAVSRCFRAEASHIQEEKGLYRVHQFTKVEMFVATEGDEGKSEEALENVHRIERELFDSLGLAYRVLDMSPDELGAPAARKYDVEAWMPGRQGGFWGEISSCSNCTDYQARRLDIRDSNGRFCHTVNGTACAVPRMIIALCEQLQQLNGSVAVPAVLQSHLPRHQQLLEGKPRKQRPNLSYIHSANFFDKIKEKN